MKNKFTKLISITFVVVFAVIFIAQQQTQAEITSNTIISDKVVSATTTVELPVSPQVKIIQTPVAPIAKPQPKSPIVKIPTKLIIPSVGVTTKILSVGTTKTGNMDTPHNFEDVGWYRYGPMPGQAGSAVIAGHYESGVGATGRSVPGVFENLNKIKVGDDIYVQAADGSRLHFIVSDTHVVSKDAQTADIFATNGPSRLTVITCTGKWLPKEKTFSNRLIVTAHLAA